MKKSPAKSAAGKSAAVTAAIKPATKTAKPATEETEASDSGSITINDIGPCNPTTHAPQSSFAAGTQAAVLMDFTTTKVFKNLSYAAEIKGAFSVQFGGSFGKNLQPGAQQIIIGPEIPATAKIGTAKVSIALVSNGKTKATGKTTFDVTPS